jgi:hypothetical protein
MAQPNAPVVPAGLPNFVVTIVHQNTQPLPANFAPRPTAPAGVPMRLPFFGSLADLVGVQTARQRRFGYPPSTTLAGFAAGYTDTDLTIDFADFANQWRSDVGFWQFRGGDITLTLSIGVHADERTQPAAKRRCLAMILEHEWIHVQDEIDIVTNWLPGEALADAFVRANVSAQARIPAHDFDDRIRGTGNGRGSALERRLQRELYLRESSRRAGDLHNRRPRDGERIRQCITGGP